MAAYKDEERGTWYVSFYYEDWTGAKKRKVKRGFRTKKEALNFEAEYKRTAKADMDMTMGEFVEVYFRDKSQSLKDRSIKNKRDTMNAQLLPYFKDRPMNSITHDIRHSHAAFLINKGVQPLMIKERFGHTDIRITLNTYGHLYPDQQKVVADMLDDENIKSSGSTNNRSNVTNGDESTNVNPRQVDYSRDSSREQQIIGENSLENGGIYGTEK